MRYCFVVLIFWLWVVVWIFVGFVRLFVNLVGGGWFVVGFGYSGFGGFVVVLLFMLSVVLVGGFALLFWFMLVFVWCCGCLVV